jgi:hypothetical protein
VEGGRREGELGEEEGRRRKKEGEGTFDVGSSTIPLKAGNEGEEERTRKKEGEGRRRKEKEGDIPGMVGSSTIPLKAPLRTCRSTLERAQARTLTRTSSGAVMLGVGYWEG